ncbi:hypothetical protein Fmac_024080 [Flemingia macrophylla]|uniref:Glutathione S-transferase n=1 Tax=Flemingia macrophylla TaxID=520843 RepID=A0ABD1LNE1_9FABA
MADLKLHGFWYSSFTVREKWTLKLKGIPYENIEEDRFNKSLQLLEYNLGYKRAPMLVHAGKPICEYMLIIEYIDKTWPQNPPLAIDPYEKALIRFWVKYSDDLSTAVGALFRSNNVEERENDKDNICKHLKVVEDQCLK